MADFLAHLKQRKLVQWALAYLAAAWVLLQVLDLATGSYHWPDTVMHIAFGVLALGFVVVLVLAWYHGEQGRQRVSGPELLLIALVLALGGGLLWRFGGTGSKPAPEQVAAAGHAATALDSTSAATLVSSSRSSAAAAAAPIPAQTIPAKSIAVLPFENLSTDKGNAYFADGMQDLILTKLADIGDLQVVSRTSTAQFGSHPENLKQVAQQLGVASILEGSVQKAGNQVLINVQLINGKTDTHIWAQSYQRTLDNIFGVEGEVAGKVADELNAKLTPAETRAVAKVGTRNPAALDAYLKAGYYLDDSNRTDDEAELARSVPLLKRAITADPNYVDAYALLALAYEKLGGHVREAEVAALHALKLDPDYAHAHTEYALALANKGEFDVAIAESEKAVALPSHTSSDIDGLGFNLLFAGKLEESEQVFRRAGQADPTDNFSRVWVAIVETLLHRYTEARNGLRYVVARDPGNVHAVSMLALAERLGFGDLNAARNALRSAATPAASSATLSEEWYELDYVARDYPAALAVIGAAPSAMFGKKPRALYEALIYRAQGDAAKARSAFAAARSQLEAKLKNAPDDSELHAALAQVLAGLGDGDAAVSAAKSAVALLPVQHRVLTKPGALVNLASVEARTGHSDDAIQTLGKLMAMPAGTDMSVEDLRINPDWDSIRHDPRFRSLLKRYAQPVSEPAASDVRASAAATGSSDG